MGSLIDRSLAQAAFAGRPGPADHRSCCSGSARPLDRLALGEEVAQSLGHDVARAAAAGRLPDRPRRRRLRRDLRRDRLHRPGRADLRAPADPRPSRPGDPAGGADRRAAADRRRSRRPRSRRSAGRCRSAWSPPCSARPSSSGWSPICAGGCSRDHDARSPRPVAARAAARRRRSTSTAGELVCLVGPNGSGKTSLLHALAGIGGPAGEVGLDGVDPRAARARRSGRACSPILPATRDVPWPLLARDLIALGGGRTRSPARSPRSSSGTWRDRRIDRFRPASAAGC